MKRSSTSLPSGMSQSVLAQSSEQVRGSSDSLMEEVEILPEPTEEPDPVLADKRHPPTVQDDVIVLLLNSLLDTVMDSWEGVPAMRPILKPSSTPPLVEETYLLDELLDVVPDTISSPVRSHKSRSDTRHRRNKEASSSLLGLKSKKKTTKNNVEKSAAIVIEDESTTSKPRRHSQDKKKRRGSRDKKMHRRLSEDDTHRDEKSPLAGEEAAAEITDSKDEARGGPSAPDIGDRDAPSFADISLAVTHGEETPADSIESWRVQFPDETATVAMKNENHYEGRISRKLMEGIGVFTWSDGTQYNGEFVGGQMTGKGRMTWPDMSSYEGDFVKGWRYGRGLYVACYKKIAYVGDWVTGRKHGSGLVFYNDQGTNKYDGEWDHDMRHGYGLRVYPSGARYLGDWRQGVRDGVGTMFFANGDVYLGNWEKGVMSGYGEYIWGAYLNHTLASCGDNVYSGWFDGGLRQGEATYELKGGQQIHGEWQCDIKEGRAKVVCGDGSVYIGNPMFEDDRPATRKIENLTNKSSTVKRTSTKNSLPTSRSSSKTGKSETPSVQRFRKKTASESRNSCLLSKPHPPDPELIMHGHYLPVYAPFQSIDLRYHLALLKTLKHPQEATGSQTDDISLAAHSSDQFELMKDASELNQKSESVLSQESNGKFKRRLLPNEQSTQTKDGFVETLTTILHEEEIPTLVIPKVASGRNLNKVKHTKEPKQDNSGTKLPENVAKNDGKSLPKIKAKVYRRKLSHGQGQAYRPTARWPIRRKLSYPAGETEQVYEEKWLRQTLVRHLPAIRCAYEEYAMVGCEGGEVTYQPFLLRAMLWQFYRDCRITTRVSLVELDQLLASNPLTQVAAQHFPFERIQLWQFLYSLIDVAWTLYASKGLGHPGSRGVLGSALDKLMYDDVLPRSPGHSGTVFSEHRDLLPLAPVYLLYQSLGEPLSARTLLRQTCCRTGTLPEVTPPRAVACYPDFAANGVNAFVLAGDLTFLPQQPPLSSVEKATYETTADTALTIFRNVGVDGLTNILVDICPGIKEDGVIVNVEYKMTFLEFYEVLIRCESRSHHCEERRLVRLAALEKFRQELEAKRSVEDEKVDQAIVLSNKVGRTKQKKLVKGKS